MSAKVPAFSDIGLATRELLSGGKSGGLFQYNNVLTINTKTADGVEFTATALKKEDGGLTQALKGSYKTKNWGISTAFTSAGTATTTLTLYKLAPGLDASFIGTLPDTNSAKLGIDYCVPHLTLKGGVGLNSSPKVDVAATTGYNDLTVGGEVVYDTAKTNISKWVVGAGYVRADYSIAALLTDTKVAKVSYAHNIDATSSAGAEVSTKLEEKEASLFTLGYQKVLNNGALAKLRVDSKGITSLLYEQDLKPQTKLAIASQFDATNLDKAPKIGLALDIKN